MLLEHGDHLLRESLRKHQIHLKPCFLPVHELEPKPRAGPFERLAHRVKFPERNIERRRQFTLRRHPRRNVSRQVLTDYLAVFCASVGHVDLAPDQARDVGLGARPEQGVWDLFQSVLRVQGFAALRSGTIWRVVPQAVVREGGGGA